MSQPVVLTLLVNSPLLPVDLGTDIAMVPPVVLDLYGGDPILMNIIDGRPVLVDVDPDDPRLMELGTILPTLIIPDIAVAGPRGPKGDKGEKGDVGPPGRGLMYWPFEVEFDGQTEFVVPTDPGVGGFELNDLYLALLNNTPQSHSFISHVGNVITATVTLYRGQLLEIYD